MKANKDVTEERLSPKANESTAKITPPATNGSDSDEECDSIINNMMKERSEEFGINYYQNIAEFSIDGVITAENLPNYEMMAETEFIADKSCILCQEENMNLEDLTEHYHYEHNIQFSEKYVDELKVWQMYALAEACEDTVVPQESHSSDEEQQSSDFEFYFGQPSKEKSQSESSSDSSSSKKSLKSWGNKKTKSKDSRDYELIRTQLITQKSFNETKFKEMESFVEQTKQTT